MMWHFADLATKEAYDSQYHALQERNRYRDTYMDSFEVNIKDDTLLIQTNLSKNTCYRYICTTLKRHYEFCIKQFCSKIKHRLLI